MNTPKNFALQLGALITLYISLTSLITLLFAIITVRFPDAVDYYYTVESATNTIRFSVAILIVFFPVYLWLTRTVNQIRRQEEGVYLTLTRWAIYLSLLIGGAVLLGDLVAVINGYLNGELTIRFFLKALVVAITISAAFYYYLKDAQNYWQTHEKQSIYFGLVTGVIVIISLVFGFMNSETPAQVREARIDDRQVQDLQDIQWRVEDHYRTRGSLPVNVEDLYTGLRSPVAPENRAGYEYKITGDNTYELCATFAQDSNVGEFTRTYPIYEKNFNWSHSEGYWCFERVIEKNTVQNFD
jgi:hypothetical protein